MFGADHVWQRRSATGATAVRISPLPKGATSQRTMTLDQWMRVNPWRALVYGQIPSHFVAPRTTQVHLCVCPKPVMTSTDRAYLSAPPVGR